MILIFLDGAVQRHCEARTDAQQTQKEETKKHQRAFTGFHYGATLITLIRLRSQIHLADTCRIRAAAAKPKLAPFAESDPIVPANFPFVKTKQSVSALSRAWI